MSWGKIKIDAADKLFSEFIRSRDRKCVRCNKPGTGEKGIEGLQCSHFWGRSKEATRFEQKNADALCPLCHAHFENQKEIRVNEQFIMGEYALFKLKQLGEQGYNLLKIQANTYKKKDRKFELIRIKEMMK